LLAKEIVHHDEKRTREHKNEKTFFSSSALLRFKSDRFRVHFVLLLVVRTTTTTTEGGGGGGGGKHLFFLAKLSLSDFFMMNSPLLV
jgi:hypothetical protein